MAKFVIVNEAPATLEKGEIVITQPTFLAEIEANTRKAPVKKLTGINHLREILNSIAEKYDHELNSMRIKLVNYEGIAYHSNEDLSEIVLRILRAEHPQVFDKYLAAQIAARPMNTKLVYYVGALSTATPFYSAGLDLIDKKDIDAYMSGKPKKVVGKPAVTDEEKTV